MFIKEGVDGLEGLGIIDKLLHAFKADVLAELRGILGRTG